MGRGWELLGWVKDGSCVYVILDVEDGDNVYDDGVEHDMVNLLIVVFGLLKMKMI